MELLEQRGVRLIVHLPVELDHHCTEALRKEIDRTLEKEPVSELEFDFSETAFMDSAGVGLILGRYKIMQALDGSMTVSHMNTQIRRILALSGIQQQIPLKKEEAL